jgi:hypothetical protein
MHWPTPRTSQKILNVCVESVSKTVIPASSDSIKCSPTSAALFQEFEEVCDAAMKSTASPLKPELSTDIRVQYIAVYNEPKNSHCFGNRDQGSLRVEDEDTPEQRFAFESDRNSAIFGSSMAAFEKTAHPSVDTAPPAAKDVVTAAPLTFELSTYTRVQFGPVCEKQIGRVVKYGLDSSSSRLILSQSTFLLAAIDLAAHEQKSATYDVTANHPILSSSSFKSFSARFLALPVLAAAAFVSPTCLECSESGPSKTRNNTRQMPKALRHRKAKAKQKANTDIAYCALLLKANRHRKATAKLKKNVEVSPVPPSLLYSPRMIRKLN